MSLKDKIHKIFLNVIKIYKGGISEDCLYMNMWVPVKKEQDQLYRAESNKANPDYLRKYILNFSQDILLFN